MVRKGGRDWKEQRKARCEASDPKRPKRPAPRWRPLSGRALQPNPQPKRDSYQFRGEASLSAGSGPQDPVRVPRVGWGCWQLGRADSGAVAHRDLEGKAPGAARAVPKKLTPQGACSPWPAVARGAQGQRRTRTSREKHKTGRVVRAAPGRRSVETFRGTLAPGAVTRRVQGQRALEPPGEAPDPWRLARGGASASRGQRSAGTTRAGGRRGVGGRAGKGVRAAAGRSARAVRTGARGGAQRSAAHPRARARRWAARTPGVGAAWPPRSPPPPALPAPSAAPPSGPPPAPLPPSLGGCLAALPAHSEPGGDREAEAGGPGSECRSRAGPGGRSLPAAPGGGAGGFQPLVVSSPGPAGEPRPGQLRGGDAVPRT